MLIPCVCFSALDELPAPTHLLLRAVVRRPTNPWLPPLQQQKHHCQVHPLLIRERGVTWWSNLIRFGTTPKSVQHFNLRKFYYQAVKFSTTLLLFLKVINAHILPVEIANFTGLFTILA